MAKIKFMPTGLSFQMYADSKCYVHCFKSHLHIFTFSTILSTIDVTRSSEPMICDSLIIAENLKNLIYIKIPFLKYIFVLVIFLTLSQVTNFRLIQTETINRQCF